MGSFIFISLCFNSQVTQLQGLLSLTSEPELAVRAGRVLAPRLADATGAVPEPQITSFEAGNRWKMVEATKTNRYEMMNEMVNNMIPIPLEG